MRKLLGLSASVLALAAPQIAHAQSPDTGSADDSQATSENVIVVTAQRKSQDAIDVPISLKVFDADTIATQRIEGVDDYVVATPNVTFETSGTPLDFEIGIRGVSNLGGDVNAVGVYLDEFNITPQNITSTVNIDLFDVEQIEVLRGPQGTLFGRNTTGGAVLISSVKPDTDEISGNFTYEIARFDSQLLKGSLNIPVIQDGLAVRMTGFHRTTDGFIRDIDPAGGIERNDKESGGARLAIRATPGSRTTIDASISHVDYEQGLDDSVPSGQLLAETTTLIRNGLRLPGNFPFMAIDSGEGFYPANDSRVAADAPFERTAETLLANLRIQHDFDTWSLIGIAGLIDNETTLTGEGDFTSLGVSLDDADTAFDSWSAELRAASDNSGPFQWTVGALFAQDESESRYFRPVNLGAFTRGTNQFVGLAPTDPTAIIGVSAFIGLVDPATYTGTPPPAALLGILDTIDLPFVNDTTAVETETWGVYGELGWTSPDDRLSLSAGLRFSSYSVDARSSVLVIDTQTFNTNAGSETFEAVDARLAGTYALSDDANIYASVSRGTKPGGPNFNAFNLGLVTEQFYDGEVIWNYEIGTKGRLFDGAFDYSLSAFYMDWSDVQVDGVVYTFPGPRPNPLTQNVPSVESYGVEFDGRLNLGENLSLASAIGWNHTEIGTFTSALDPLGNALDVTGNRLPLAPEWTATLAMELRSPDFSIGGINANLMFRPEYIYRDQQFEFLTNISGPSEEVPSYDMINLRLVLDTDRFKVIGFAENVEGDRVIVGNRGFQSFSGTLYAIQPPTYGVRLQFDF